MTRILAALALALAACGPAAAQTGDAPGPGGDLYRAGGTLIVDAPDLKDVFLTGERVELTAPIAGAAHLAARRIETTAAIGGGLYAVGADVRIAGPVAGAASLTGYDVTVLGAIGGNLRAFGRNVTLRGPVAGAAVITGDTVEIAGVIAGDAVITAETLAFADGARIDGDLTLHVAPGAVQDVPASVIPPERIDRRPLRDEPMAARMAGPGWAALALGFAFGVVILALLATVTAALAPQSMARLRAIAGEAPLRAFGYGFLTQSTLIGGSILLVLTLVGVVLAPFVLIGAVLIGLLGYVVAVYLLGEWILSRFGALEADTLPEFALASLAGALAASLLAAVPFFGWFVLIALSLVGVGAMTISRFRPRYYV